MKILSFILVVLLGGFMPAGNLSAADKKQNPHHITVKNSRDLHAYFRYAPDRPIVISGHRGGMLDGYPENCIESFEKTLSYMESFFEIDPRLTKDGVIVLMHDETIDRTTTGKGKVSDYTYAELYKLAETPCKKPILKTASLFSCMTSLRISDILSLCWEDIVDYSAGGKCVHIITQKNKAEDIIPISEEALGLIGYSSEKKGLVFKGLMRSWTQIPMKEWIRSAGITKNITFHSYRRTFATLQAAAGTDIRTIQSIMAHKSITTTQRYIKVVDANKREASKKITLTRQD